MIKNAALEIRLTQIGFVLEEMFESLFKVRPEIEIVKEILSIHFDKNSVSEEEAVIMMFTVLGVFETKNIFENAMTFFVNIYKLDTFFKKYTDLEDFRIIVSETCRFYPSITDYDSQDDYYEEQYSEQQPPVEQYLQPDVDRDVYDPEREDGVYLSSGRLFIALNNMNIPSRINFKKPEDIPTLNINKFESLENQFNSFLELYELTIFPEEELGNRLRPVLCELEDFKIKITHNNEGTNELLVFCLNDLSNEENIEIISVLSRKYDLGVTVDLDLTYEFANSKYIHNPDNILPLSKDERSYLVRRKLDPRNVSLNTIKELYSDFVSYNDSLRDFKRVYAVSVFDCSSYLARFFGLDEVLEQSLNMFIDTCNEGIFFKRYFLQSELPEHHCGMSKEEYIEDCLDDLPF